MVAKESNGEFRKSKKSQINKRSHDSASATLKASSQKETKKLKTKRMRHDVRDSQNGSIPLAANASLSSDFELTPSANVEQILPSHNRTDKESTQQPAPVAKTAATSNMRKAVAKRDTFRTSAIVDSASDSDSTVDEDRPKAKSKAAKKKVVKDGSDSEDLGSYDATHGKGKSPSNHLINNRLQVNRYRQHDSEDPAIKFRSRLVSRDLPQVSSDFFISDSDSDSDSGASYNGEPELEWHKYYHPSEKVTAMAKESPIKTGTWSLDERLRLEKRIKKICRRENMSLEDFRENILFQRAATTKEFWWKIAKVFPERALRHIIRRTRKSYDSRGYSGPWTAEEDQKLKLLVETEGRRFKRISQMMNRSESSVSHRYHYVLATPTRKVNVHWTEEEIDKLIEGVKASEQKKSDKTPISWDYISKHVFHDERSARQCCTKWAEIKTINQDNCKKYVGRKSLELEDQIILLERMLQMGWKSEQDIKFSQLQTAECDIPVNRCKREYFRMRSAIKNFEQMSLPDLLNKLLDQRRAMLTSLA